MTSYKIGTCNVTPGSTTVTIYNTNFDYITSGRLFRTSLDSLFYTIDEVDSSSSQFTLTESYRNSDYEYLVVDEAVDTGDDTSTYSFTLVHTPVIPGTAEFSDEDDIETFTDNADGTLTGDAGGTGTINYTTGVVSLAFDAPIASGKIIYADDYEFGEMVYGLQFQMILDYTDKYDLPEPFPPDEYSEIIIARAIEDIDSTLFEATSIDVEYDIFDSTSSISTGDGKAAFSVPLTMDDYILTDAIASVHTKGVTATTDIQIRRRRNGSDIDMLTTPITIGDEYYARDGAINASNDDTSTGDQIYIDVDTVHSGTAPKGLFATLTFKKFSD